MALPRPTCREHFLPLTAIALTRHSPDPFASSPLAPLPSGPRMRQITSEEFAAGRRIACHRGGTTQVHISRIHAFALEQLAAREGTSKRGVLESLIEAAQRRAELEAWQPSERLDDK